MSILNGIVTGEAGESAGITALTQDVTASGTGSVPATVVQAQNGTLTFGSSTGTITGTSAATAFGLVQSTPGSDVAPNALAIQAQNAYGPAATNVTGGNLALTAGIGATTNGVGGSVVANIKSQTYTSNIGSSFKLVDSGTNNVFQVSPETTPGAACLWLGLNTTAPTLNNPVLYVTGGGLNIGAGVGGSSIALNSGAGTTWVTVSGSAVTLNAPSAITWAKGVASPTISQATPSTDAAINSMTVAAQSAYASASTNTSGGSLTLQGGAITSGSTGTPGSVIAAIGAPTTAGTNEGYFQVTRGGTLVAQIGHWIGTASANALWLEPGTAPTSSNYTLLAETGQTNLNTPSTSGYIVLSKGGGYSNGGVVCGSGFLEYGSIQNQSAYGGTNVFVIDNGTQVTTAATNTNTIILQSVGGAFCVTPANTTSAQLQVDYGVTTATTTTITHGDLTHAVNVYQAPQASTSAGSGGAGQQTSLTAQAGQAATGASNNGGNGGNLLLAAGVGGTSGSATAGLGGIVAIGSGMTCKTVSINASTYTVDTHATTSDYLILQSYSSTGTSTITLPAPTAGRVLVIKDSAGAAATHSITISQHASEKIDGANTYVLDLNYACIEIQSDGTNWFVTKSYNGTII